jgi:hypothetical protein
LVTPCVVTGTQKRPNLSISILIEDDEFVSVASPDSVESETARRDVQMELAQRRKNAAVSFLSP